MSLQATLSTTLIIATYNKPDFLRLVFEYLQRQIVMPSEVIVADDGSGESTRHLIEEWKSRLPVPLIHIWHEDKGFRLGAIRNRAIEAATGQYLIFVDGDILMHPRFVADHIAMARRGVYVTGSRCQLGEAVTTQLLESGRPPSFAAVAHGLNGKRCPVLTPLFYYRKSRNPEYIRACNMGVWRSDVVAVNGFNEDIEGWGHEDTEFSWRLHNSGVKKRFLKFRAVEAHLWHGRDKTNHSKNAAVMAKARDCGLTVISNGLRRLEAETPAEADTAGDGNPVVSVIIPNYNYARYLRSRIESVLAQTYADFEIIILDDCSTDSSREVIEQYRGNPKVSAIIYGDSNSGSPFVQWEKGIAAARGQYIWIAEADDEAEATFLEKTVAALRGDSLAVMAMSLSDIIDEQGEKSESNPYEVFSPTGDTEYYRGDIFVKEAMLWSNSVYNASMVLFRRDAYESMSDRSHTDMRYCGDWQFWVSMAGKGNVAVVREKLNRFRRHGVSVSDESKAMRGSSIEIFRIQSAMFARGVADGFDSRWMFAYRSLRDCRGRVADEELRRIGINHRYAPFYWTYKHMLRWLAPLSSDCYSPHAQIKTPPLKTLRKESI